MRRKGEKLSINRRTFGVLRQLVERSGQIVSDTVWADAFVEDNSLMVAMTSLRKLLGDDPKLPKFIENLPRKGYRFIGEVSKVSQAPNPVGNGHPAPIPTGQATTGHFFRNRKLFFAILVACLLGLEAVLGLSYVGSTNFGGLSASSDC